ncbi:hypothetical protein AMTRI_Chr03g51460 [Amborella trichopoda]
MDLCFSFQDDGDWTDPDFIEALFRKEKELIAVKKATQPPPAPPPSPSLSSLLIPTNPTPNDHQNSTQVPILDDFSTGFSPPRELSQSFKEITKGKEPKKKNNGSCFGGAGLGPRNGGRGRVGFGGKEKDIEALKAESRCLSEQLAHRDHEYKELVKRRDEKDEQLRNALSQIAEKEAEIQRLKRTSLQTEACGEESCRVSLPLPPTGNCHDQIGPGYPVTDNISITVNTPWIREGTSKRLSRTNMSSLDTSIGEPSSRSQLFDSHGPNRKDSTPNLSAGLELKSRHLVESASRPSHGIYGPQAQENICPETSAQPKCTEAIGVQTDMDLGDCQFGRNDDLSEKYEIQNKLLQIWHSPTDNRSGHNLVSKLFVTCATDLHVLFRCMTNVSSNNLDPVAKGGGSGQSVEAAKVCRLYAILTKMNNEMAGLDSLVDAILDLCNFENVDVVCSSLRILHFILHYILAFDTKYMKRSNDEVGHRQDSNSLKEKREENFEKWKERFRFIFGPEKASSLDYFSPRVKCSDFEAPFKNKRENLSNNVDVFSINWMSLFEKLHQTAVANTSQSVQLEAISIMNLVVMRSEPNMERETFGTVSMFENISKLLKMKAAILVRLQAVRLLFLLLNCPGLLKLFNSGSADDSHHGPEDASRILVCVLEGLAECLCCDGNGTKECILRRHAIHVMAFIAASGKSGTGILLNCAISIKVNFLESLLKILTSELDSEEAEITANVSPKERTLLIREALILLCRLVSNPTYSKLVLESLTSSREMSRSAIDITNRITRKRRDDRRSANQGDIVDLARVFRARILPALDTSIIQNQCAYG